MVMPPCIRASRLHSACSGPVWRLVPMSRSYRQDSLLYQESSFMNRKRILIVLIIVAAVAGTALYAGWFRRDTGLQGSGTVEARDIRVGSKIGGRIDKVLVREGDSVQPGQILITFDDKELQAALEQSRANAQKALRGYRPEEIAEARAAAAQAKADDERTHLDFDRYDALARKDLVSKQQRDTAEANWKVALAQQENALHKLDELKRGYRPEEIASAWRVTTRRRQLSKNSGAATAAKMSNSRKLPTLTTKRASASARSPPRPPRPWRSWTCVRATSLRPIRPSPHCSNATRFMSASTSDRK